MKKFILDLETTGLNAAKGDKIIEICCLEILNRKLSKNIFHVYLNPEKKIDKSAYLIHGIKDEFLENKFKFNDIIIDFLNFILNSEIIIHNSKFDLNFLNLELLKLGFKKFSNYCFKITDTLLIAKIIFPNKRNSLNALCKRFNIDITKRILHSALLDVILLGKVYLHITKGQNHLNFINSNCTKKKLKKKDNNIVLKANKKELIKHNFIINNFNNF